MQSKTRQRQTSNNKKVHFTNKLHSAILTILEEAAGQGYSEKKETRRESPRHLLVLSGASLADSRSHPNDRTCLMLAVVNCQARTV